MKRFIILISVLAVGAAGVYGTTALMGEDSFFSPPAVAAMAEQTEAQIVEETAENLPVSLGISFSHNETFYDENIEVELITTDSDAVIYYSLNGSDPDETSIEYKGAISVRANSTVRATTIKAIAVNGDERSEISVKSYVTGREVFSRFDPTTLVFVLSTDPYNLYDYYYGVAIEGYLRDEYKKSDEYKGGNIDPPAPANYNIRGRESEREFYVEVYDSTGKKLIEQAAGAKISGGWSRATSQKSWRLIARNSYSEGNGMFKYSFFPDAVNSFGMPVTKYDRITLRNGANDRDQAGLRDELSLELAKMAGFPDTQESRPAAVFLNGEYYGFSWLKEAYCEGYLEQTYGGIKENYQIVQNTEDADEGEQFAVDDYRYMYNLAYEAAEGESAEKSFENDEIFNEFCSLVDIDNLMLYYAIQTYIDNKDWPNNNVKVWKYYASDGEEILNPYNDGKWRFFMFDVEFAWGLYGNGYNSNTIKNLISGNNHMGGPSVIMKALFQREDMREQFANTICDLISGAFKYENVVEVITNLAEKSEKEFNYALKNGYTSSWANEWTIAGNRFGIIEFAEKRENVMLEAIRSTFNVPDDASMYRVKLINAEGAAAFLNSRKLTSAGEIAETRYFTCYGADIGVELYSGYEFSHWEVNGTPYYEPDLRINAEMAENGNSVEVILHTTRLIGDEPLYVEELYTSGGADWVKLYNPNSVAVSTKDYYMSDDVNMLNRWKMPTVNIPSESSLVITMKNNKSVDSLKKLQTNFSLKEGETLFLSDMKENIICAVEIVDMSDTQSLKRLDDGSYKIVDVD